MERQVVNDGQYKGMVEALERVMLLDNGALPIRYSLQ